MCFFVFDVIVMDYMFVSLKDRVLKVLTPNVVVLAGGAFGR